MQETTAFEYDELLRIVGEFGRLQVFVMCYNALMQLYSAVNILDIVFLLAVPNHICQIPQTNWTNVSSHVGYADYNDVSDLLIPREVHDGKTRYDQCSQFGRNVSALLALSSDTERINISNYPTVPCSEWDYDTSQISSSFVTQLSLVCDRQWLVSTAQTISMMGLLFGVFFFGNMADKFGRRKAILLSIAGNTLFRFVCLFSVNYTMFVVSKFMVTFCAMGCCTVVYVLSVEMVGPSRRVFIGMLLMYCWGVGYSILAGVAYIIRDVFYLQLAFTVPLALLSFLAWFLPESSRWLYSQGRTQEAQDLIFTFARINKTLKDLPSDFKVKINKSENVYVIDLFKTPTLRKYTICFIVIWFAQSALYYGLVLNSVTIGDSIHFNFLVGALVEFPACIIAHLALRYIGRKIPLCSVSLVAASCLLLCIFIPRDNVAVLLFLTMAGKVSVSVAIALMYLFTSELNPTVLRSVGLSTASTGARIGGMCAPIIAELGQIQAFLPSAVFGAVAIVAAALTLPLPETKDKPLPNTVEDVENFSLAASNFTCLRRNRSPRVPPIYQGDEANAMIEEKC